MKSEVAQWCPTLCDPMDCSLPGSSGPHRNTPSPSCSFSTSCLFAIWFLSNTNIDSTWSSFRSWGTHVHCSAGGSLQLLCSSPCQCWFLCLIFWFYEELLSLWVNSFVNQPLLVYIVCNQRRWLIDVIIPSSRSSKYVAYTFLFFLFFFLPIHFLGSLMFHTLYNSHPRYHFLCPTQYQFQNST